MEKKFESGSGLIVKLGSSGRGIWLSDGKRKAYLPHPLLLDVIEIHQKDTNALFDWVSEKVTEARV